MIRQEVKLSAGDKIYFPAILKGMWVTLKHLIRPQHHAVIEYPEKRTNRPDGYRGFHRLNKDSKGRLNCVACEMCATACPAHAITIVPEPAPAEWTDRERIPKVFEINMLRCIYCGMCEEACPKDAIELTKIHDWAGYSREDFIWDKERLLKMYDNTNDEKWMAEQGVTVSPRKTNH
ncbi:NuoI/complex I 23 kDa subunit family protein [candidate division KSB1 bacterium]